MNDSLVSLNAQRPIILSLFNILQIFTKQRWHHYEKSYAQSRTISSLNVALNVELASCSQVKICDCDNDATFITVLSVLTRHGDTCL